MRLAEATAEALELPALLAMVASFAATDLGRARGLALAPVADRRLLEARRSRFEELGRALEDGPLVPPFEEPLSELLETAAGEGMGGVELRLVARLLAATAAAGERLRGLDPGPVAWLEELEALPDLDPLRRRIERTLDPRGRVREDASPELKRLRGQIRRARERLYDRMQELLDRHRDDLSEGTVPMREGRLVLVLKAGARGRVPGLVHGRSGSGRSFFFEPFDAVELNNDLQQAVADEQEEERRLLAELVGAVRERLGELEAHTAWLGELDLWQAAHRFGERAAAAQPGLAPDGSLSLIAGRHPLLDPLLADVRQTALGRAGHREELVPLDLELSPAGRVLVITGPNAGGKTVALKTAGLLALAAQCGLPVPASPASRLPVLRAVAATVGDEQDVLADRSTFSGRLVRLGEAWELAGDGALVLIDELGSGTDPEEGAALAVALIEELVGKGCLGIVTTHLSRLAAAALELEGAACAAMEFDAATGEPTFRLMPGTPGGSEALALARRLGLPASWLERAEAKLSPEHRDLRALLAAVESTRQQLDAARRRAEVEARDVETLRRRSEQEVAALGEERRTLARRLRAELEAFRLEVRERLAAELDRLRAEPPARPAQAAARAVERLFADAPAVAEPAPEAAGPLEVGRGVRHRSLGWRGRLERLDGDEAVVVAGGKRLRCSPADLEADAAGDPGPSRSRVSLPDSAAAAPAEIHLRGWTVEPALEALDAFLDQALLGGRDEVRVVHGHGTGRLREAVRERLRGHRAVGSFRPGEPGEGGNGVTVISLAGGG